MNSKPIIIVEAKRAARFLAVLAIFALFTMQGLAQTAGGTVISNTASATYSDGTNSYSTVSNTVTVTVANVSGLRITPDAGTIANVVAGQQNVVYTFSVTNLGNFADQVRFLQNGQSIILTGSATLNRAVIDVDNSGTFTAGDVDIKGNTTADVLSSSINANASIQVLVEVNISASAAAGSTINVQLGDASTGSPTYDNQAANSSAREVRTVSTASVNGLREARGDVTATVENDAQLQLSLTAPAGPVDLGTDIQYTWTLCNTGARAATSVTLTNGPSGSNTGVFIFAPIPVGTSLKSGQTFPAGTLYTTSALTVSPMTAVWTTTAPADLTTVRRVAFRVGASLGAGACGTAVNMQVTITTTDATNDIYEIGDAFGTNAVGSTITDQSGDSVSNAGDGNANFNEGNQAGNIDGDGIQQITILRRTGDVRIGPSGAPNANGPTSNNDDYTNRSMSVPGVAAGGTIGTATSLVFTNTVRNFGNANDSFLITRQSIPTNFTVEVSIDNGANYTTLTSSNSVSLAINFNSQKDILVRITAPSTAVVLQAGGFPSVIRATSVQTSTAFNETIDRFYTGFVRLDKTATVANGTGVGAATDAVPGAVITYKITYTNISSSGGGAGNVQLNVSSLTITENGATAPNNWATTTTQVVGSASDTNSGTITGDTAGSNVLTDTVANIAPGGTGFFQFGRRIN